MSAAAGTDAAISGRTPLDLPLDRGGTTFIEASAGTGKTHALTTLVARLVLEEGWSIDRILVVTFTRTATAELRDRIRRVLGLLLAAVRVRLHESGAGAWSLALEARHAISDAQNARFEADDLNPTPGPAPGLTPSPIPRSALPPSPENCDPHLGAHGPSAAGSPAGPAGLTEPRSSTDDEATGPEIDPQARELLAAWEGREEAVDFARAARRLEAAMHDIDRANVFTIHGFCQRVLADLAFESGFPFGCEVSGDGGEMVAGAVRDFWRRRLYPASMLLMRYALENGFLPDGLAGWVSGRRAKIGAAFVGCDSPAEPTEAREAAWCEVFEAVRLKWEQHRSRLCAEVLEGPWLNRRSYRTARVRRELAAFEALFSAPEPRLPAAGATGRYGREQLSQACKRGFAVPANPLFDALDRLEEASGELRSAYDQWLRWTRREALIDVRQSVRSRIRTDRRLAYDDLLIELDDALGNAGGKRLAEQIRREFPCALIDEYQDTDPVQARIFTRIYGGTRTAVAALGEPTRDAPAVAVDSNSDGSGAAAGTPDSAPSAPADSGHMDAPESDGSGATARAPNTAPPAPDVSGRMDAPETAGSVEGDRSDALTRSERSPPGRFPGPFIVVGDPKQSIYRFRGADVFAYLAARRAAHERLHLDRNWRSVPALVEAVNAVFAGTDPFVTSEIEYRPVAAARDGDGRSRPASGADGGPLELRLLPRPEGGKPHAKKDANPVVASTTANEVARLLELGAHGEAVIEDRPLTGADVAVLVRTREQGRLIAAALRERGVRSIEIDDGSVFHTREAEQLERLLWSLAEPGREPRVRGALAGDLFGFDGPALLALSDDEGRWSAWTGRLADWRAHWESRGIGSVLLRLLEGEGRGEGGAQRLLGHRDGARRLTNYRHLAELLQETETRERLSPAELAAWLNHRRADSDGRDDDHKLRIESDEQLVKILTVHGAKGLEFPVVFCPFAWDARSPRRRSAAVDAVYHLGVADDYREVIDLDPDERAEAVEWLEEFSESVRLLYVALTRAKYRCVVAWGQVRGAEHAPLAWLLHRSPGGRAQGLDPGSAERGTAESTVGKEIRTDDPATVTAIAALQAVAERFAGLGAQEWRGEIDAFARGLPGAVSVSVLDPEPPPVRALAPSGDSPPALAARELRRPLRRIRSLTSFSALSTETLPAGDAPGRSPVGRDEAEVERPDHDQHEEPPDALGDDMVAAGATASGRTAFTFPRGPVAGSCLHRIFERLDTSPEIETDRLDLDEVCRDALDDFGIDGAWRPVARAMVERTRGLLLREPKSESLDGFRLTDPHRRLVELEFHFPVEGLDRGRLAVRLVEHGYPDPFARAVQAGTSGSSPPIHGFLRGYVDLVVEHAGRWYILDYKSNWLGPRPGDYAPEALAATMRAGGYTLQSLIYLVALHRYLEVRLPGYDYERHVGGAFYLFVRGIDPAAGMRRGVFFDRPPAACLLAVDDCFRSGGA